MLELYRRLSGRPRRRFRSPTGWLPGPSLVAVLCVLLAAPGLLLGAAHAGAADGELAPPGSRAERLALARGAVVARLTVADQAEADRLAASIDIWSHRVVDGTVLARVSADQFRQLRRRGFTPRVELLQSAQQATAPKALPGQKAGIPGFPCYRTVEETYRDLARLAADNPRLARWLDIGDSWEKLNGPGRGYDIHALVLTNRDAPGPKAPLLIDGSIHAREYTTAELVSRFAELLVAGYGNDPDITWILDHVEVHIIPYVNPDGRKRAEGGLLWRKNVNNSYCTGTELRGVDLNRNQSVFWGGPGSSGEECSQIFRGPSPTSEPESQVLASYMNGLFRDQRGPADTDPAPEDTEGVYINVHSFGRLILPPWDDPARPAPNREALDALAQKMAVENGHAACVGLLGRADGNVPSFAYGEFGVASYTFELGTTFFESCGVFEQSVLDGNLRALLYAAKAARRPYRYPFGPEVLDLRVAPAAVRRGDPATLSARIDDTRRATNSGQCQETPAQDLRVAFYTVDRPPWELSVGRVLGPPPGRYTSSVEAIAAEIDTSDLAPGRHLLFVSASDVDGNVGPPSAVFLEVLPSGGGGQPLGGEAGPGGPVRPRPSGGGIEGVP